VHEPLNALAVSFCAAFCAAPPARASARTPGQVQGGSACRGAAPPRPALGGRNAARGRRDVFKRRRVRAAHDALSWPATSEESGLARAAHEARQRRPRVACPERSECCVRGDAKRHARGARASYLWFFITFRGARMRAGAGRRRRNAQRRA